MDSNKRIVYDMFGEEGLSTSWEVGPRLKTPQEVGICYFFLIDSLYKIEHIVSN